MTYVSVKDSIADVSVRSGIIVMTMIGRMTWKLNVNYNEMKDIKEYAKLVKDMRDAQNNYFSNRTPFFLNQAKAMERVVDKATKDLLEEKRPDPQGTLF
ncbi:MAG: hypothetical protein QHC79_09390 [Pseudosphingobacterium sp.]|nr:hypothetical protein [Pseudosphingobacterium sp.]